MTIPVVAVMAFAVLIVAAAVVAVFWWASGPLRRRTAELVDECECGQPLTASERHLLVASFTDDAKLGGPGTIGGTFMAAAFCADHCPSGCDRGCVAS